MAEIEIFLQYLQEQFKELELSLTKIFKEEKSLHDEVLVKKGFIIHSYSFKYSAVKLDVLSEILAQLENVLKKEVRLQEDLEKHSGKLETIEKDYELITKKKLHTSLLAKYLKEALYYCRLMIRRIKQLTAMLQDVPKLHKKSLPRKTEMFFASFEHVGNKIFRFIIFLEKLTQKIVNYEKEEYYPEPRTYGRMMAPPEYRKTFVEKRLCSSKDPTPVFDAPRSVIAKIKAMSKDQMKNFFRQIGVVGGVKVVFFQTRLKPINHDNPVPQSNGLREYKFPKNVGIEILEAA